MRKLVDKESFVAGVFGGRLVDERDEATPQVSPLWPADRAIVDWASSHWAEVNPDDFEWDLGRRGMEVRHRESDEVLRIQLGHPYPGSEAQSRVKYFCIRGGRLILLAEPPCPTTRLRAPPPTAEEQWRRARCSPAEAAPPTRCRSIDPRRTRRRRLPRSRPGIGARPRREGAPVAL